MPLVKGGKIADDIFVHVADAEATSGDERTACRIFFNSTVR